MLWKVSCCLCSESCLILFLLLKGLLSAAVISSRRCDVLGVLGSPHCAQGALSPLLHGSNCSTAFQKNKKEWCVLSEPCRWHCLPGLTPVPNPRTLSNLHLGQLLLQLDKQLKSSGSGMFFKLTMENNMEVAWNFSLYSSLSFAFWTFVLFQVYLQRVFNNFTVQPFFSLCYLPMPVKH